MRRGHRKLQTQKHPLLHAPIERSDVRVQEVVLLQSCPEHNSVQVLFGYALSVLLLHELECRSRTIFLCKRWRNAPLSAPRWTSCTRFGALTIPVLFLLSAVVSWELVESFWEARGAILGASLGPAGMP